MNYKLNIFLLLIILFTSCAYKVPLVDKSNVSINPKILGSWSLSDDTQKTLIHILELSKTKYLIHLQNDNLNAYMEGQLVILESNVILQIKFIGDNKTNSFKGYYQYLMFDVEADKFSISSINRKLIDVKTLTTLELRNLMISHLGNRQLFVKSDEVYHKIK